MCLAACQELHRVSDETRFIPSLGILALTQRYFLSTFTQSIPSIVHQLPAKPLICCQSRAISFWLSSTNNMHLPYSVVGQAKQTKKKQLEAVSIFNQSGVLKEFGVTEFGNGVMCYVPVSLGDSLTLNFEIPSGEMQIVDVLIDGIVRETIFNNRAAHIHRGKIIKVCACERRPSGAKGKLQHCDMAVQNRRTTKGNYNLFSLRN